MMLSTMTKRALAASTTAIGTATVYRYQQIQQRAASFPTNQLVLFPHTATTTDDSVKQNVLIIGGGVVGVTAAYKLAQRGHPVALLEANDRPGEECSKCAAGGMQRSNPSVDKNTWIAVIKSMSPFPGRLIFGGQAEPYQFFHINFPATLSDPFFYRWLYTFTRTSLFPSPNQQSKQEEQLKFTNFAVQDMVNMMKDPKDNMAEKSGWNNTGSLALSYDPEQVVANEDPTRASSSSKKTPANATQSKLTYEPYQNLTGITITQQEPSITFQQEQPTMAKFEYESSAASSERFTKELAERCTRDLGVTISYNTKVLGVTTSADNQRISQIQTTQGVIDIPDKMHVVVAAGAWTPHILALMDVYCPVYPLKGYAMSVRASEALKVNPQLTPADLPSRIVCDKYMYTSRLGPEEIRITSIGEFSGWSTQPTPEVDVAFRQEAKRQFPQLASVIDTAKTYCGHRPYVSDGILLLGQADVYSNLYVSCGPGSNGWKLAMGSGDIMRRVIEGQSTAEISQELGFDVSVLAPTKDRVMHAPLFAKLCRAWWNV